MLLEQSGDTREAQVMINVRSKPGRQHSVQKLGASSDRLTVAHGMISGLTNAREEKGGILGQCLILLSISDSFLPKHCLVVPRSISDPLWWTIIGLG